MNHWNFNKITEKFQCEITQLRNNADAIKNKRCNEIYNSCNYVNGKFQCVIQLNITTQ